jgi:single-strand DNA-binding protein
MRVIVQGRLKTRSNDDREGNKRTVFEIDVDEVGPSLRSATAKVTRAMRSGPGGEGGGGGFGGGGGNQGGGYGGGQGGAPQNDPWATPQGGGGQAAAPQNDPWASQGGGSMEEPPF